MGEYACTIAAYLWKIYTQPKVIWSPEQRLLHTTNPALHLELTSGAALCAEVGSEPDPIVDEDMAAPDGCDIPFNAVRSAVINGSCDAGFVFRYGGGIERTGNAEDPDYRESEDGDEDGDVVDVTELRFHSLF